MKRHSVVFKLFLITSIMIILLFAVVMMLESMFFEKFYRNMKLAELQRQTSNFTEKYEQITTNNQAVSQMLGHYMNEYDASIAVLDSQFQQREYDPYYIVMQLKERSITIILPKEGMTFDQLPIGLHIGNTITVDGIYMDQQASIMHPVQLLSDGGPVEQGLVREQGTIIEMQIPEQRSYNPLYQDLLVKQMIQEWMLSEAWANINWADQEQVTTVWNDPWSGIEYVTSLQKVTDEQQYVLLMTSLQPVDEAVEMMKKYVLYIFPIIIMVVFILALFYSRYITKPLVRLNSFAGQLAKLKFSEKSPLSSKDEFGQLATRLVELSTNLDATLTQLSERNEQLQVEMKEKQRSEQLRKELVANISHELKTPLAIVKAYAEGLQDGVAKDKGERYLSQIVNESDRMNDLIIDMLELSKYEVKAIQLEISTFHIVELIHLVSQSFSKLIEEKNICLVFDPSSHNRFVVEADYKRITQVLINLMSNAIRHAPIDSQLTITLQQKDDGHVVVSIHNEGEQIPEQELINIWEKFYRLEQARDRMSGGTGLGLAIVSHILQLHQSQYGVSNTKQGVVFYFSLTESE
ncbi:sensor histidine kinase [Paenibacillus endoradicis]|uniref:sensor histidine kinase n=1 Tax=Paenibacillus endoradicis TaxID=2972487 RepID=UPI0021591675|nr:ATP-binding protein [Paenibacillus endoradicis]MCR8656976.1 ATP-binding protein [Paenibacillus endoradicis]